MGEPLAMRLRLAREKYASVAWFLEPVGKCSESSSTFRVKGHKVAKLRREVWAFLVHNNQTARWPALLAHDRQARQWLAPRLGLAMCEQSLDERTASTIIMLLFLARHRMVRQHGRTRHGLPQTPTESDGTYHYYPYGPLDGFRALSYGGADECRARSERTAGTACANT
jgi:hypothetical protein